MKRTKFEITRKTIEVYVKRCLSREEPPTIDKLASFVGVHRNTVSKTAAEVLGMTLRQYIDELRHETAQAELRKGTSNAKAAYRAGFVSRTGFQNSFRRRYGKTPGEYRSEHGHSRRRGRPRKH